MRSLRVVFVGLTALGAGGCIQAALSAGQPTALERQLLGAYESLDEDLVHASSVRADRIAGPGPVEALRDLALRARAVQRFNQDDLIELKDAGCLAETLDAEVAPYACDFVRADPAAARRQARVVDEENRARVTLQRWAAQEIARQEGRASPRPEELAEVRAAYRRLVRETARPGHLVEVSPGDIRPVAK